MKKKVCIVGLLLVLMVSFAFASGSSETADKTSGSSKPLSVMIWDSNQEPGIRAIIDDFTAKTGISADIQVVNWDNYWTLLSYEAELTADFNFLFNNL